MESRRKKAQTGGPRSAWECMAWKRDSKLQCKERSWHTNGYEGSVGSFVPRAVFVVNMVEHCYLVSTKLSRIVTSGMTYKPLFLVYGLPACGTALHPAALHAIGCMERNSCFYLWKVSPAAQSHSPFTHFILALGSAQWYATSNRFKPS